MFGRRGHDRPAPGDPIGGWCESCGTAFAVGASRCPECDASLSSPKQSFGDESDAAAFSDGVEVPTGEAGPARELAHDGERHDVVEYDLADWDEPRLVELTRQLDLSHIPHEWHHRVLRVPGAHEAEVDAAVDAIDGLDEDAPAVEYELPQWTMEQCDELVRRLQEAGLSFDWDGCVLAVDPSLEHTVDGIVRSIDPSFQV